jgi:hypothetical protein
MKLTAFVLGVILLSGLAVARDPAPAAKDATPPAAVVAQVTGTMATGGGCFSPPDATCGVCSVVCLKGELAVCSAPTASAPKDAAPACTRPPQCSCVGAERKP